MNARDDGGFTVLEIAFAAAISLAALAVMSAVMVTALRTGDFAKNQSTSLDGARNVLNQVARDLQGSKQFSMACSEAQEPGSCVVVVVQRPSGADRTIRLRLSGTVLYREEDDGTGTFPLSARLSERLANLDVSPSQALFSCSTTGSLLQVSVHMLVQPDPLNAPHYRLDTVIRPRNTYQPAGC